MAIDSMHVSMLLRVVPPLEEFLNYVICEGEVVLLFDIPHSIKISFSEMLL